MKPRRPKPQCYMCDSPATSREHVPPLCLFPETKDVGGRDYRLNLITVPSCDKHNAKKKSDDEFLMLSLAGIIGNNSIGYRHRLGKVERAIRGNAARFLSQVLTDRKAVHRFAADELGSNDFIEVIWGTPDVARLTRCFEHVAFGLHQHHFHKRFSGRVHLHLGFLTHEQQNARSWNSFMHDRVALELDGKPITGSNPDVFFYQVSDADNVGLYMVRLCFYGGLNVYAAFQPSGVALPANIATELIGHGVQTVITLGDRTYEFNG